MNQWQSLLRNVGDWRGCFDTMDRWLELIQRQSSVFTLQSAPSGVSVDLTLLLWSSGLDLVQNPYSVDPDQRICQSRTHIDPDLSFFTTGQLFPWDSSSFIVDEAGCRIWCP